MINGVPVVEASAEIDISNAELLRVVLLEAASRGHATIVVDMTRTPVLRFRGVQRAGRSAQAVPDRRRRAATGDPR